MANKSGTLANVAIAIAAIAVAGSAIYGEFFRPRSQPGGIDPTAPPEYVEGWETLAQIGLRTGNASAPMQIVEFADF